MAGNISAQKKLLRSREHGPQGPTRYSPIRNESARTRTSSSKASNASGVSPSRFCLRRQRQAKFTGCWSTSAHQLRHQVPLRRKRQRHRDRARTGRRWELHVDANPHLLATSSSTPLKKTTRLVTARALPRPGSSTTRTGYLFQEHSSRWADRHAELLTRATCSSPRPAVAVPERRVHRVLHLQRRSPTGAGRFERRSAKRARSKVWQQ